MKKTHLRPKHSALYCDEPKVLESETKVVENIIQARLDDLAKTETDSPVVIVPFKDG